MSSGRRSGRILLMRGGAVGDFILTLPALRLLREELPGNRVEILGYPSVARLALHWGLADDVRPLEHGGLARFFVPGASLPEDWSRYFASFDVVISHLYDPDGFLAANLRRAGVQTLLQGPHRPEPGAGPAALQLAAPLEALALHLDRTAAARPFARWSSESAAGPVAIHPGSGGTAKNWPLPRWVELVTEISGAGRQIVVLSGEAEDAWIGSFLSELRAGGVALRSLHQEPLTAVVEALGGCAAFVGHDSGLSHLAAATGMPSLILFGPTDPEVWAPLQENAAALRAPNGDLSLLQAADVLGALRTRAPTILQRP